MFLKKFYISLNAFIMLFAWRCRVIEQLVVCRVYFPTARTQERRTKRKKNNYHEMFRV